MNEKKEKIFNFWYFYESFQLTKTGGISNSLKKYRILIFFFGDAHFNSHSCSRFFLAQHSQLRVTKVFTTDINISCFSLTLAEVFLVKFFLYDVNQSYFLSLSVKIFFRWCWLGLFSHWRQSCKFFPNVGQKNLANVDQKIIGQHQLKNSFGWCWVSKNFPWLTTVRK